MTASTIGVVPSPLLSDVQLRMQAAIMDRGISRAKAGLTADQHSGEAPEALEPLIAPSRAMQGAERLAIYQHAYRARLVECLESEFPVLRKTVGEEAFLQFAQEFIHKHPSRSYTLGRLSEQFVEFLDRSRPPDAGRRAGRPDWSDFVIDLALLERTINRVFDGPGGEGRAAVTASKLSSVPSEQWPGVRFEMEPSIRLLTTRFPVHQVFLRDRADAHCPECPRPSTAHLLVFRRDFVVRYRPLPPGQARLIDRLCRGAPLSSALLSAVGDDDNITPDTVFEWLRAMTVHSLVLRIRGDDHHERPRGLERFVGATPTSALRSRRAQ